MLSGTLAVARCASTTKSYCNQKASVLFTRKKKQHVLNRLNQVFVQSIQKTLHFQIINDPFGGVTDFQ